MAILVTIYAILFLIINNIDFTRFKILKYKNVHFLMMWVGKLG